MSGLSQCGPLKLSTIYLLNTYQVIQKRNYERKQIPDVEEDVQRGRMASATYYSPKMGELLFDKYEVLEVLGKGSFGIVVKARNILLTSGYPDELVAIKIIRKGASFLQQGKREYEILNYIETMQKQFHDSRDLNLFVNAKEFFFHNGHLCIVFELLSDSLYELIGYSCQAKSDGPGLSLRMVRKMAHQLLCGLVALKNLKIIHCDIKPENVALIHPNKPRLKILDFGSFCFESDAMENQFPYIQSRYYRAPEVLLGTGYDCAIDMWSLGCLLVELYTGRTLFVGKDTTDQLYKIIEVLGALPEKTKRKSVYYHKYFNKDSSQTIINVSKTVWFFMFTNTL